MKLLAIIKPEDVDHSVPQLDYRSFKPRAAARAIVLDGDKIALILVAKYGYYMLPGGGIDDDEIVVGLKREVREELGCEIDVVAEIGRTVTYMDRWSNKQDDCCYAVRKVGDGTATARTDFEKSEGHKIVWAKNLAEAIRLVESAKPQLRDGKIIQARDLLFLKTFQAQC